MGQTLLDTKCIRICNTELTTQRCQAQPAIHAFNIGFEKILDANTKIFTKYAESFRTPNIDERIKATTSLDHLR